MAQHNSAQRRFIDGLVCPHCGYDLRAAPVDTEDLTYRCPECGCLCKRGIPRDPPLPLWQRSDRPRHLVTVGPGLALGAFVVLPLVIAAAVDLSRLEETLTNLLIAAATVGFVGLIVHAALLAKRYAVWPAGSPRRGREQVTTFAETILLNIFVAFSTGWLIGLVASLLRSVL